MTNFNRINPLHFLLFCIITNSGGEGKTAIAQILLALMKLGGSIPFVLDSDPGNLALKELYNKARVLGWGAKVLQVPDIMAQLSNHDALIDTGANTFASGTEIAEVLPAIEQACRALNYLSVAFLPVTPSKSGNAGSIQGLFGKINFMQKFIVLNDRDGSNVFDPALLQLPHIKLAHLQPGYQQYLLQYKGDLCDAIMTPTPDFEIAAAHIAYWLIDFASQPAIQSLMGSTPVTALLAKFPNRPAKNSIVARTMDQVTNVALQSAAHKTKIVEGLHRVGWTLDGLETLAAEMRAAALVSTP